MGLGRRLLMETYGLIGFFITTQSLLRPLDVGLAPALTERFRPARHPGICIVKSVLGFRQFLLWGLENVKSEWDLGALAWNLKRMYVLTG